VVTHLEIEKPHAIKRDVTLVFILRYLELDALWFSSNGARNNERNKRSEPLEGRFADIDELSIVSF
jgi:hypothetical protein